MAVGNPTKIEGAVKPSSIAVDGYEPNVFAHRHIQIETNQQGRWDYGIGSSVIYAGYAPKGLLSSESGWLIQKFTYDSNGYTTQRQIAYDIWDNRASASFS